VRGEHTEAGFRRTWESYGPLVAEGQEVLAPLSRDDLTIKRDHLETITAMTDRHRDGLTAGGSEP
jgi:hypothetical protein